MPSPSAPPRRRVCFQEVPNLFFLNAHGRVSQAPDDIADQPLLRIRLHHAEKISRLCVVVIVQAMIVAIDRTGDRPRTLPILGILPRPE
jgi:hypothetical protein